MQSMMKEKNVEKNLIEKDSSKLIERLRLKSIEDKFQMRVKKKDRKIMRKSTKTCCIWYIRYIKYKEKYKLHR